MLWLVLLGLAVGCAIAAGVLVLAIQSTLGPNPARKHKALYIAGAVGSLGVVLGLSAMVAAFLG